MESVSEPRTFRSLIKQIPPTINLANIERQPPFSTCQLCKEIRPRREKADRRSIKINYELVDIFPNFPSLKVSADAGCHLCWFIRKTIRSNWAVRPMEEWGVAPLRERDPLWDELLSLPWDCKVKIHKFMFFLAGNGECQKVVGLDFEFGPSSRIVLADGSTPYGEIGQVIGFRVYDSIDMRGSYHQRRRLPEPRTISETNYILISGWINNCKLHHSRCQNEKDSWVPTRLLDVHWQSTGKIFPRLVETKWERITEPYAALSHMWGDTIRSPLLRTLSSNYRSMLGGIPTHKLPRNFDDAVKVACMLGIRYIWIDSLCIIQDDLEDWKNEAATMHKVYRFAEVTIAATSAESAHDGFLDRDLSTIPAIKVQYPTGSEEDKTQESFILASRDDLDSGTWGRDVEACPWNTRGWTMQERSLSTRTLHFCKNKLYFECRECIQSEENEPLESYSHMEMWPRTHSSKHTSEFPRQIGIPTTASLYNTWNSTVTEYSRRNLTKITDTLPAIQSIAAEMQSTLDDSYIPYAAMWKGNLKHDLLWQVRDNTSSRPAVYLAPTWSWASLRASIGWNNGSVKGDQSHTAISQASFEVIQVTDESSSMPPHCLVLKAWIIPIAFIIECPHEDRHVSYLRTSWYYDIFAPNPHILNNATYGFDKSSLPAKQNHVGSGEALKFAEARLDLDDQDNLTISSHNLVYLHVDHTCHPSGIILEAVESNTGFWNRVGVATIFGTKFELLSNDITWGTGEEKEVRII